MYQEGNLTKQCFLTDLKYILYWEFISWAFSIFIWNGRNKNKFPIGQKKKKSLASSLIRFLSNEEKTLYLMSSISYLTSVNRKLEWGIY